MNRIGGQGTRSDLEQVVEAVTNGSDIKSIAGEFPIQFIRYGRGIEHWIHTRSPAAPRTGIKVLYIWGDAGTGKSLACHTLFPEAFWWPIPQNSGSYASGYTGERTVILDEYYGWLPYAFWLRIIDQYPITVNAMGRTVPFQATTIIMTANSHYKDLYEKVSHKNEDAIKRRIHHTIHVTGGLQTELIINQIKTFLSL